MNKNTIIGFILALVVSFFLGFGLDSCKADNSGAFIDTAKARIDTVYSNTVDTIYKDGKVKLRIDSFYYDETTYIYKNRNDTGKMKHIFDSIYSKSDSDTTITGVQFTQIVKAIDVNYKFNRDSSKLFITERQLATCTTGLRNTKNVCDSALDSAKKVIINNDPIDKKTLTIGGLIILILGLFAGTQL